MFCRFDRQDVGSHAKVPRKYNVLAKCSSRRQAVCATIQGSSRARVRRQRLFLTIGPSDSLLSTAITKQTFTTSISASQDHGSQRILHPTGHTGVERACLPPSLVHLMRAGGLAQAHDLGIVSHRVKHKGGVVIRPILRAKAGRTIAFGPDRPDQTCQFDLDTRLAAHAVLYGEDGGGGTDMASLWN